MISAYFLIAYLIVKTNNGAVLFQSLIGSVTSSNSIVTYEEKIRSTIISFYVLRSFFL